MTAPEADVIDAVLELRRSPSTAELREQRATMKRLTQTSYAVALRPQEPRKFSYALRAALAARMAGLWKSDNLAKHYRGVLAAEPDGAAQAKIDDPAYMAEDARLAAILRHVDLVTLSPKAATRANVEALKAAGLDDRDIVTLAGLIAFVNYQVLVVAGLEMLRDN